MKFLVEKIVAGKTYSGHHQKCVKKILKNIRKKEWQQRYPNRIFVFSVFYALEIRCVIEIKFSLYTQALELLYFHLSNSNPSYQYNANESFGNKFSYVFEEIYKWNVPEQTANVIRILRNDVTHTGTIAGVTGANCNPKNSTTLKNYFQNFGSDEGQLHTDVQNRIHLAHSFMYLMDDILIRVLGLTQDDLSFNGNPPWHNPLFGYDHNNRPQWLRE